MNQINAYLFAQNIRKSDEIFPLKSESLTQEERHAKFLANKSFDERLDATNPHLSTGSFAKLVIAILFPIAVLLVISLIQGCSSTGRCGEQPCKREFYGPIGHFDR